MTRCRGLTLSTTIATITRRSPALADVAKLCNAAPNVARTLRRNVSKLMLTSAKVTNSRGAGYGAPRTCHGSFSKLMLTSAKVTNPRGVGPNTSRTCHGSFSKLMLTSPNVTPYFII